MYAPVVNDCFNLDFVIPRDGSLHSGPERGSSISGPWTTAKTTIVNNYIFLNGF
jgi:hypothetical protein